MLRHLVLLSTTAFFIPLFSSLVVHTHLKCELSLLFYLLYPTHSLTFSLYNLPAYSCPSYSPFLFHFISLLTLVSTFHLNNPLFLAPFPCFALSILPCPSLPSSTCLPYHSITLQLKNFALGMFCFMYFGWGGVGVMFGEEV